ncbi:MAG TPA: HAD family hydrolase [Gemmatimonadaceae bacterium]|jgi:D,D-heptose 1,7-bisphosphate phosphatase
MSGRPAAFLDRDGTIMRDASYVSDPSVVELLPGAAAAIRGLNERSIPVIVVTNQSGIARGWLTEQDFVNVRDRLDALLGAEDAHIDATYMCPHHPEFTGPCDCRKPGTLLYRQAMAEHHLDATRSLFTGDRLRDVEPAAALGGYGVLLDVESTPAVDLERAKSAFLPIAGSLADAVDLFLHLDERR